MIARYTRPGMGAIWDDQNKFRIWLDIELLACEAQAELGNIPKDAVKVIREKAAFEVGRIDEIEAFLFSSEDGRNGNSRATAREAGKSRPAAPPAKQPVSAVRSRG